jgi:H+-translocating NAD(P) transhydrogenase subunit alpha
MIVGVPRESYPGERRVALVPGVLASLAKAGMQVMVEAGAGESAGYPDSEYADRGAQVMTSRAEIFSGADIITQVLCYGSNDKTGHVDLPLLRSGQVLVGFLRPLGPARRPFRSS